ncbi:unnamed protein product [Oppiella nova]|uniref:Protein kinase domain-containing protein n=1 Tax=Oppiella nova TaxID=334625 RepID=A0A7R9QCV0_9ACAR|nr:unnamed protein product [Oppiella nova]CAG2163353.1 unnamed protein product [Oppiella nova]
MVVNDAPKANSRSVRPKLKSNDANDLKIVTKNEKKHRLKQRFEVIRKLGQGTYGKVQLAINKQTGQEVAIKTIKKSKVESDQDLIRIRREIQIMSSIQHPHIIHIYEVFENRDKIVLVMQYASGGEVYEYVSDRKVLSDSEARRIFRQIATAIYYCHKNKICHRDLKLENILLDEKGNAKIADFGLSNVFDERHYLQTFCGSPLYASPEIVKGLPYFGPEINYWTVRLIVGLWGFCYIPWYMVPCLSMAYNIRKASELIKRLLTPNPTERATIIDICTDLWVNNGFEHSLLKVAEDMANLTPVRLEILLALAPVSPSAEKIGTNPFDLAEDSSKEINENKSQNTENLDESRTDANSLDNSLKKRQANPSFDQSLTKIPTQTPKKKKTKKSQNESQVMTNVEENKDICDQQIIANNCKTNESIDVSVNDKQTTDSSQQSQQEVEVKAELNEIPKTDNKNVEPIESKGEVKKKVKKERSGSTKRPGKLSIPNLWNKSLDIPEPLDDKTSQSSDSKCDRKAPFIPIGFRVSDAKRAFERRCSVPVNSSHFSSFATKRMDSKIEESDETKNAKTVRQRAPKLSSRSLSLNEMLESPKRVLELNDSLKNKDNDQQKCTEIKEELNQNKVDINSESTEQSKEEKLNDLISSPVMDKNMAKDILTKTIAKAKLMDKRHNSPSKESTPPTTGITTPLVSIENSDLSILSEPSFFRKPRPENCENTDKNSSQAVQTKAAPIARSYKKVTFTKDGACITETGKIYSSEGADGSYTRVEKKSKVTHFPYEDQSNQSQSHVIDTSPQETSREQSLQRSDSQSSSGSLDIFDDIFDNHWCGESIFPNMRSLLHSVVGNRKSRRRSRAESCERNASDWFGLKKFSPQSDHESEADDYESPFSRSVWPTTRPSIFERSSIFSNKFDKDFNGFDDLNHSIREMNRSVSRDRSSFESRVHPKSFNVVFGPQTSVRTTTDRSADPFETDDIYDNSSKILVSGFGFTYIRLKRVEQWLQSDNSDDNSEQTDSKTPFSMYATVGPRGVRRYLRTISSRSTSDKPNNEMTNSLSNMGSFGTSSGAQHSVPSTQTPTVPKESVIEMRFTLNPTNIESNRVNNLNTTSSGSYLNTTSELLANSSDDLLLSNIVVPESSSLLDQLRTHGYRNTVQQRLSGSSLFSDLDSNLTENDVNYKRGKSVLSCSSQVVATNGNANACECQCMDQTNPMATSSTKTSANTSSTTSEAAIAAHNSNAYNNNELKASDSLKYANQIDIRNCLNDIENECIDLHVRKQSPEPTSRSTARKPYNNSETSVTDDSPECNPTLKPNITTNKSVNFKESVQERIHRKSFYSRFNERPVLSSRTKRRSFIDSDDLSLAFGSKLSSLTRGSNSFRSSLSYDDPFASPSKSASNSSDWFQRMESRVSQLMDDLSNDRISSFGSHFRNDSLENNVSFGSRRRSSSTTRSDLSTPRSYKSDFDSYFNSVTNSLNDNQSSQKSNDSNDGDLTSPQEVIQKAINILSQSE